jgi:uncharacterized DUF497 family protein
MWFDWDEEKARLNLTKHGISFDAVRDMQWDAAIAIEDQRVDYGEKRYILYAPIRGRVHALVFTRRKDQMRIISLRKANPREIANYERAKADRLPE